MPASSESFGPAFARLLRRFAGDFVKQSSPLPGVRRLERGESGHELASPMLRRVGEDQGGESSPSAGAIGESASGRRRGDSPAGADEPVPGRGEAAGGQVQGATL